MLKRKLLMLVLFPCSVFANDVLDSNNNIAISTFALLGKPEITYERKVADSIGLAIFGGFGKEETETKRKYSFTSYGFQLNKYLYEKFFGLHLGVEVMRLTGSSNSIDFDTNVTNNSIGIFGGSKIVMYKEISMIVNLGVKYVGVEEIYKGSSATNAYKDSVTRLLADVKIGWVF